MDYCEYHPVDSAQFYCKICKVKVCEKCIDSSNYAGEFTCLKCEQSLVELDANSAKSKLKNKLKNRFVESAVMTERSAVDICLAKANIFILEGNFSQVIAVFEDGIRQNEQDFNLLSKYFDFLVATKASEKLNQFGATYLTYLIKTHRKERVYSAYKNILDITGDFEIIQLNNKIQIAKACYERGNYKQSVKLLFNVRSEHPRDVQLLEAFQVMHDALIFIPGQEKAGMRVRQIMKDLMANNQAGKELVDDSLAKNAIRMSLKPRKRIDLNENKRTFESLNKPGQHESKFEAELESKQGFNSIHFEDKEQDASTHSKYSNFGVQQDEPEDDIMIHDDEVDFKGFELKQESTHSVKQSFKNSIPMDVDISQEELESMYSGSTDYKHYGLPALDESNEDTLLMDELKEDDLTLDDSDSISNSRLSESDLTQDENKKEDQTISPNEGVIEFTK